MEEQIKKTIEAWERLADENSKVADLFRVIQPSVVVALAEVANDVHRQEAAK